MRAKVGFALVGFLIAMFGGYLGSQVDRTVTNELELLDGNCVFSSGSGAPSGGSTCDMYFRSDGAAGTTFYVNEGGTFQPVDPSGSGGGGGAAGGGGVLVLKTADESVDTSITLQDDDHLFFSIKANETRVFEMVVIAESDSNTPDITNSFTVPSGATIDWCHQGLIVGSTGTDQVKRSFCDMDPPEAGGVSLGLTTFEQNIAIQGTVVNGSTAGTVQYQWAQDTSNGTASTVNEGSWLIHRAESSSGALANVVVIVKPSDETVTSSETLQDDDDFTFQGDANTDYEVVFNLIMNGLVTADMKYAMTVPTGATGWTWVLGGSLAMDAFGVGTVSTIAEETSATFHNRGLAGTAIPVSMVIKSYVSIGGTAGPVTLQWAQDTSQGTATTMEAGSWMKVTTVNGLADVNVQDTYANRPTASAAGRMFYQSDGPHVCRDSGSVWDCRISGYPIVEPPTTGWSWINQGTATVTTTNGGIQLFETAQSGINLRMYQRTAPSTPYEIEVGYVGVASADSASQYCGVFFREDGTGEVHTVEFHGNDKDMRNDKWDSPTAFDAGYTAAGTPIAANAAMWWVRIGDDGSTNRTVDVSADGIVWAEIFTVGRTDFLTADRVGIFCNEQSNQSEIYMWLFHWNET